MKTKIVSGIMLTLLFIGMLTLAFKIQPVKAEPTTWTVDDDGPADFSSIQEAINSPDVKDGDTIFVYNGTYYENVIVRKSLTLIGENTVTTIVDCSGRDGFKVINSTEVTISKFTIQNFSYSDGIRMEYSDNCKIVENTVSNGGHGIDVHDSNNNTIYNNYVTLTEEPINIDNSKNNFISHNTVTLNNDHGIEIQESIGTNTISNNIITSNNEWGILLELSDECIVSDNIISDHMWGIVAFGSSGNNIINNTISNNEHGIYLEFWEASSENNLIYHNNMIDNIIQAYNDGMNSWDNGYPSGGNYWSDYTDVDLYSGLHQNETGSDGIWDHPYVLDTNNTDRYPLMIPRMKAVVHTVWSEILNVTSSWNDTDPGFGVLPLSGECNATISPPDVNGVRNMTVPKGSGYIKPAYNPISNITIHSVSISDSYGKLYTIDGVGDVDIISMTNDTGMFFKYWMDGTWHPAGEDWLGDGDPDPAGSAWFTGMLNVSHYLGNGTDGPLIGSYLSQFWLTTGFSKNTVDEPNSRLNGFSVNATGVPFLSPYVGSIGTYVSAGARLNTPFGGEHLDVQSKTDQLQVTPKAIMFTLFSPANLYVTDPVNRHIGAHPTTGEPVNEIPGAFYSGPGSHPQRIVIPDPLDGVYDIKIVGTNTGEYTLVVELATVENITAHTYTGNISVGETWESQADISEGEMTSTPPSPATPVGGISLPVNKLELLTPYLGLTMLLAVAVITVVYVKKRKRDTEINS